MHRDVVLVLTIFVIVFLFADYDSADFSVAYSLTDNGSAWI